MIMIVMEPTQSLLAVYRHFVKSTVKLTLQSAMR